MGNWRTVHIIGTCAAQDVEKLRAAIDPGADYQNFHCLSSGSGLCGVGDWAAENIDRIGNLAERDYDPADVARALSDIGARVPSLRVKVHCGGDYESKQCVATVSLEGGGAAVGIGPPQVQTIGGIPPVQIQHNLQDAITAPSDDGARAYDIFLGDGMGEPMLRAAKLVQLVPLEAFDRAIEKIERAESMGPLLDPTNWRSQQLARAAAHKRFLRAARTFRAELAELKSTLAPATAPQAPPREP